MENDVVPESFVKDGAPDLAAWRASYDDLTSRAVDPELVPESFRKDGKPDFKAFREKFDELSTGIDFEQIPEQFRPEGKTDLAAFRLAFDEMASFKAQQEERLASVPKSPEDVVFSAPEDLTPYLPEGFEWPKDEEGNPFPLEIDDKDPLVGEFRTVAAEEGITQKGIERLRDILVKDNIARVASAMQTQAEEKKLLGPDAQSRIDTVKRAAEARLPAAQASALLDMIGSADALRAVETLMSKGGSPTSQPGGKPDIGSMSIDERLELGFQERQQRKQRA